MAVSPDGKRLAVGSSYRTTRLWEVESGKEIARLKGHSGSVNSLAFSPDGKRLASGGRDTTLFLWDLAPEGRAFPWNLSAEELTAHWQKLEGDNAWEAYRAMWRLALAPSSAIPFLRERLQSPTKERFQALLKELEADDFKQRERATVDLAQPLWEKALREELTKAPPPETERRIAEALKILASLQCTGVSLAVSRATQALEMMGTSEARTLLESLGTSDAKAALERLRR